jgi:regulator of protease activity HflC (stomatin/prohibitin superfamily)
MVGGIIIGLVAWFLVRYLVAGLYTVDQNERAVKTIFGRADRLPKTTLEDPFAEYLRPENLHTAFDFHTNLFEAHPG